MGATDSLMVDNKEWCNQHREALDPNNPDATYLYARQVHPWLGEACITEFNGKEPLAELAKSADVVSITCCDKVGYDTWKASQKKRRQRRGFAPPPGLPRDASHTSVGNCAHLALFHRDHQVRTFFTARIVQWRRAMLAHERASDKQHPQLLDSDAESDAGAERNRFADSFPIDITDFPVEDL